MITSELITQLEKVKEKYGDLPVTTELTDEISPLRKVIVVDAIGCDVNNYQGRAVGIHLTN